jgi:enamine deaminase RidA (YjgF/YER057c/UK114 family)
VNSIRRIGSSPRWSDIVIYRGVARWVEVAEDASQDARGQIAQVLLQVDQTLEQLGSGRTQLLEIVIYLADLADGAVLNELWDQWVPRDHAPIRACVQAGLSGSLRVEMIVSAAVPE